MKTQAFYKDGDTFVLEMKVGRAIEEKLIPMDVLDNWMEEFFKEERDFFYREENEDGWYLVFNTESAFESLKPWMVDQFYFDTFLKPIILRKAKSKLENPKKLVSEILKLVR
jgi:hypothetical protein